ncbi:MAG: hypothetical protein BJ554DRAFT_5652 [Olpidium bornovanus]|uniref:Uncharacterized protein n=1 Tax=Olpidium bornovanus TaxID=278681 RepID=A0A8H8DM56_9FUNG|nr:MAG: hypothetical protein BJ554DRAFT_5652 [Olpidium bornovanus]
MPVDVERKAGRRHSRPSTSRLSTRCVRSLPARSRLPRGLRALVSRGIILLVGPRVWGPSCPRSCPRSRLRLRPSTASRPLPFARRPSPAARLPWRRSTGGSRAVPQHTSPLAKRVHGRHKSWPGGQFENINQNEGLFKVWTGETRR